MQQSSPWFSNWDHLGQIALMSLFFYGFIILMTRLSGKRTTGQMNNFDWVITVAVGSLAASGILLEDVAVADAVAAILVLGASQYLLTFVVVRSDTVAHIVKAQPTLLTHRGEYLEDAMRRTRVSRAEIDAALREKGLLQCKDANWVVLETDGTFSVIDQKTTDLAASHTMRDVLKPDHLQHD